MTLNRIIHCAAIARRIVEDDVDVGGLDGLQLQRVLRDPQLRGMTHTVLRTSKRALNNAGDQVLVRSPALAAAAASSVSGVRYGFGFTSMMKGTPLGSTRHGPPDATYLDTILSARRSRTTLAVVTNLKSGARQIREPTPSALAKDRASGDSGLIETAEGNAFRHVLPLQCALPLPVPPGLGRC